MQKMKDETRENFQACETIQETTVTSARWLAHRFAKIRFSSHDAHAPRRANDLVIADLYSMAMFIARSRRDKHVINASIRDIRHVDVPDGSMVGRANFRGNNASDFHGNESEENSSTLNPSSTRQATKGKVQRAPR